MSVTVSPTSAPAHRQPPAKRTFSLDSPRPSGPRESRWNRRNRTIVIAALAMCGLLAVIVAGQLLGGSDALVTDLPNRNQPPTWEHPFGTDRMGRDMLLRTLLGLRTSLVIGFVAAAVSAVIGAIVGVAAAIGGTWGDRALVWLIDVFMALPHLILLILIAFVTGGGIRGVTIAVAVTHWTRLARVVRAEVLELKEQTFVHVARQLGQSRWSIATKHIAPHVMPQFLVGIILLFPHAILHEAALSFVGIGMSPDKPAIGVILAESLRSLAAGHWWLTLMPGLALLAIVLLFDVFGEQIRALINPKSSQQ